MATNKRIMEKYYEKKSIKNGLVRNCKKCKTKLSRYNNSDICSVCEKNIIEHSKKIIWNLLNELS
jgi:uncharacterized hydantoinase/oxoprolinase family protein